MLIFVTASGTIYIMSLVYIWFELCNHVLSFLQLTSWLQMICFIYTINIQISRSFRAFQHIEQWRCFFFWEHGDKYFRWSLVLRQIWACICNLSMIIEFSCRPYRLYDDIWMCEWNYQGLLKYHEGLQQLFLLQSFFYRVNKLWQWLFITSAEWPTSEFEDTPSVSNYYSLQRPNTTWINSSFNCMTP